VFDPLNEVQRADIMLLASRLHTLHKMRSQYLLLVLLGLAQLQGCATYSDRTAAARDFAAQGNYDAAVDALSPLLGVDDPHEQPVQFKSNRALVLLERAMLHQARGDYVGSRDDLLVADKQLELLDYTNTVATDIASYIYSDSSSPYKISPVERLTLNAINMLNYLAEGDLSGARVEAKRFTVIRKFLEDTDPDHAHGAIGSYLAGFIHEHLGETGPALRHYDEALDGGHLSSLEGPVARLAQRSSFHGRNVKKLVEAGAVPDANTGGDILVVVGLGRVPFKVPERIPIGVAIGIVAANVSGDLDVLSRSAFKVVIFPELVPAQGSYTSLETRVDDHNVPTDEVTNIGAELVREYAEIKPKIITAAVTRMISRAIVAEGARKAGREIAGADSGAAAVAGLLTSFVAEGLLIAADKPDTRSWTLLPEKVYVSRSRVPAGTHEISVDLVGTVGVSHPFSVDIREGGYALVVVMPLH
jgi:hypothetical protein